MKRQPITLLLCTSILAAAPTAYAEQSCAVDAPENFWIDTSGSSGVFSALAIVTDHVYDESVPLVQHPNDQRVVYTRILTNPAYTTYLHDDSLGFPFSKGLTGVPVVQQMERIGVSTSGEASVFLGLDNGRVNRIDETWSLIARDLGRGGGCNDEIGDIAVFPRVYTATGNSPPYNADIFYAGTNYSSTCAGYKTDNMFFALDADDLSILWMFNSGGSFDVDGIHGIALDRSFTSPVLPVPGMPDLRVDQYGPRIFFTTEQRQSTTQHSLWALDAYSGAVAWSVDAGRIVTRPVVRDDRIYVATIGGDITAFDKSDGSLLWTLSHSFIPFMDHFTVGLQAPYDDLMVITDYFGDVLLVRDNGTSGEVLWTTDLDTGGGEVATTQPVIDDVNGYIYVGADDGKIYQLDIATGSIGPTRIAPGAGNAVSGMVRQGPAYGSGRPYTFKLFAVTEDMTAASFCTPFMYPPGTLVADGDINTDGFVNAVDVLLAMQAATGIIQLDPVEFGHGDVAPVISSVPNPNGTFDLGDLLMITRKALFGSF